MRLTTCLLLLCPFVAACEAPTSPASRRALSAPDGGGGCGAVPYQGCCIGQTLVYCAGTQLQVNGCSASDPCGWSTAFGIYSCGGSAAVDPSGVFPRDCQVDFGVPAPDAAGPVDAQTTDATGCGPLGYAGCCKGQTLYFCSGSQVLSLECSAQPSCGWNASSGYYDCNTAGGADPAGIHPLSCMAVLGDSGVSLDGLVGGDQGADLAPADLSLDTNDGAAWDSAVPGDLLLRDATDDAADGGESDGGVGLDASGLDVSELDGNGTVKPGGGGGCSGCVAGSGRGSGVAGALLLLGLLGLARRTH